MADLPWLRARSNVSSDARRLRHLDVDSVRVAWNNAIELQVGHRFRRVVQLEDVTCVRPRREGGTAVHIRHGKPILLSVEYAEVIQTIAEASK
jgi:hypothetical protein